MNEGQEMNFDKFIELMNLQIQAAIVAARRKIVSVMGVTGAGKSTFLNYFLGTVFNLEPQDDNTIKPVIVGNQAPWCEMGTGNRSCTFLPQALQIKGEDYLLVDLPGFKDTNGDLAKRMCAAAAPYMLNQTLKASQGQVQALVWVLSANLTENNGQGVREMLSYFSKIAKGDIKTITRSLVIVVSKANAAATPEGIMRRLKDIVDNADVGVFTPAEIVLFKEISKNVTDKVIPVIVARIDDKGTSAKLVRQAIASKSQPLSPHVFDFSNYCPELQQFNKELLVLAESYNQNHQKLLSANEVLIDKAKALKDESAKLRNLKNASNALEEALAKKETELKSLNNDCISNEAIIDNTDRMTHLVQVGEVNKAEAAQTVEKVLEGKFPSGCEWAYIGHNGTAAVNGAAWTQKMNRAGYVTDHIKRDKRHFKILAKKTVHEPVPGTAEANLRFEANYPVVIKPENKEISGNGAVIINENCAQGYTATVRNQVGHGYRVRIGIFAQTKYLAQNVKSREDAQKKLADAQEKMKKKKDEINELKKQIEENKNNRKDILKRVDESIKDVAKNKAIMRSALHVIRDNLILFTKVFNIVMYFDLDKKSKIVDQFVRFFDRKMPIDEMLKKLDEDESEEPDLPESPGPEVKKPDFQAKRPNRNVRFWDEAPTQFADIHWYSDEEIDALMKNYLGGKVNNLVMNASTVGIHDDVQGLDGYIRHELPAITAAANQRKRVFLPVNQGGNHWVLVILDYSQGKDKPVFYAIDPMGDELLEVKRLVKLGLGLSETVQIQKASHAYQIDGFNCGPWIVELARYFAEHNRFPTIKDIDINAKRNEHKPICQAAAHADVPPKQTKAA